MIRLAALLPLLAMLVSVNAEAAMKAALLLEHEQASPWTELLRQGLAQGAAKHGLEAETIILPPGQGQRDGFRKASSEHDLVIVASDSLHELLRDNAANFRRVKFGSVDAGIRAPNIMSITFADEQAAFLAGAMAATAASQKAGKNGAITIGWLSGADVPALRSLFNGYREGAVLEKPGCRVIQALVGSFTDGAAAARKMQWLIDSGASVVALAAGAGNREARSVARKAGVEIIDLDRIQDKGALGAIVKSVPQAVEELMASAAGQWRGKEIVIYNLANGGVDFAPRAGLDGRRMKELRRELETGGIKLHSLRQRTLCDCLD